jgi:hypothetical protein
MHCEVVVDAAPPRSPRVVVEAQILEQNLARHCTPELAQRVLAAAPAHAVVERAASGAPCLSLAGLRLCSRTDPEAEAEAWATAAPGVDSARWVVVFGLALGEHLRALRRRTRCPLVVVEPSLEVIRAALSTQPLAVDDLVLVDNPTALREHLARELDTGEVVALLVWPPYRRAFPELAQAVRAALEQASSLVSITARTLDLRLRAWSRHLALNLPRCVGAVPAARLRGLLRGRPAIVVAAGPSLDRNVDALRDVGGRAAIIAVNTSLRALERAGVRADLVVALEVLDVSTQLAGLELNRRCPRVLCTSANPALFESEGPVYPFADTLPFFAPLVAAAGLGEGTAMGGSVANAAFALAIEMGASSIVLVGQDLAWSEGRAYARDTVFGDMRATVAGGVLRLENLAEKERIAATVPEAGPLVPARAAELVAGWGGGQVGTSLDFNYFRFSFERWARQRPDLELVNATEGGARIRGFAERRLAEVVAALPPGDAIELPGEPRLGAPPVRAALERELEGVRATRAEAASAAELGTPQALGRVFRALRGCGLLDAYAWPALQALAAEASPSRDELCRRVGEACDEVEAFLEQALGDLRRRAQLSAQKKN